MTVKELLHGAIEMADKDLIEKLQDYDPSTIMTVHDEIIVEVDDNWGDEAGSVHSTKLELNFYSDWWYGEH